MAEEAAKEYKDVHFDVCYCSPLIRAKETAENLNTSAATVDDLSANSANGTSQISQAVGELASTAQTMAETVQDANGEVIKMGDIIDVITGSVENMVSLSKESYEGNQQAVKAMDVLQDASDKSGFTSP